MKIWHVYGEGLRILTKSATRHPPPALRACPQGKSIWSNVLVLTPIDKWIVRRSTSLVLKESKFPATFCPLCGSESIIFCRSGIQWQRHYEKHSTSYISIRSMHTINFALSIRSMFPRMPYNPAAKHCVWSADVQQWFVLISTSNIMLLVI